MTHMNPAWPGVVVFVETLKKERRMSCKNGKADVSPF